ncbi:MAG TPA: N-carbamoylputrescine amidase [Thermoleophilia bacterium]|nr:N-carbamoylputrescine amidase [Thermoleophilia bacterium]
MTREVTLAAIQFACTWELEENLATAERLVREAAAQGAQIVLLQELFETPYFCITQETRHFALARPLQGHPTVARFARLAAELGVVIPVSFFERGGQAFFNSVAVVDADGSVLGVYRKSHIPDSGGYQEKYYFSPGDTGLRVWETRFGRIGVGICWDQWFPEAARAMALQGAEVLLYPTAIGSDPPEPDDDSRDSWQLAQRGHAVSNAMPVVAANRIGLETASVDPATGHAGAAGAELGIRFYGSSFIADQTGALLAEASRDREEVVVATVDLDAARYHREDWSFFRDRRPELYRPLLTLDGEG